MEITISLTDRELYKMVDTMNEMKENKYVISLFNTSKTRVSITIGVEDIDKFLEQLAQAKKLKQNSILVEMPEVEGTEVSFLLMPTFGEEDRPFGILKEA